jgi:putative toxin-antitoxin system antitoxin component (TIGR02293 family)
MLLGGKGSDDRMDIYHAVLEGFTLRTVLIMVESSGVYRQSGALAKIMGTSDRTLARRLQAPDQTLTPEQSTRALHYAEIMERATDVLGNRRLAEQWMTKPAPGLDGEVPLNLIANAVGYELVSELLTRMDYGVY